MSKTVRLLAATYAGYWLSWFALLVACALLLGGRTVAEGERAVAAVLLGRLALIVVTALLSARWIWKAAPAGAARAGLVAAFLALLAGTVVVQAVSTLVVFNR